MSRGLVAHHLESSFLALASKYLQLKRVLQHFQKRSTRFTHTHTSCTARREAGPRFVRGRLLAQDRQGFRPKPASYGPNQIGKHFSAGELVHFTSFLFQVTYCSSRWFAKLGPFPAATIDFSLLFSDLPQKRSRQANKSTPASVFTYWSSDSSSAQVELGASAETNLDDY